MWCVGCAGRIRDDGWCCCVGVKWGSCGVSWYSEDCAGEGGIIVCVVGDV